MQDELYELYTMFQTNFNISLFLFPVFLNKFEI